jgi:hypothetical protein
MITKIEQATRKGFMQGYACAIYMLIQVDGRSELAGRILRAGNFKYSDFKNQDIDSTDMKILKEAFEESN